jgi:hypothetical protein
MHNWAAITGSRSTSDQLKKHESRREANEPTAGTWCTRTAWHIGPERSFSRYVGGLDSHLDIEQRVHD